MKELPSGLTADVNIVFPFFSLAKKSLLSTNSFFSKLHRVTFFDPDNIQYLLPVEIVIFPDFSPVQLLSTLVKLISE